MGVGGSSNTGFSWEQTTETTNTMSDSTSDEVLCEFSQPVVSLDSAERVETHYSL